MMHEISLWKYRPVTRNHVPAETKKSIRMHQYVYTYTYIHQLVDTYISSTHISIHIQYACINTCKHQYINTNISIWKINTCISIHIYINTYKYTEIRIILHQNIQHASYTCNTYVICMYTCVYWNVYHLTPKKLYVYLFVQYIRTLICVYIRACTEMYIIIHQVCLHVTTNQSCKYWYVYMYTCIFMYVYVIYVFIYIYIYMNVIYACIHMIIYTCVCVHIHTCIYIYLNLHFHLRVCTYAHIYTYIMDICIYMCIYIYICIQVCAWSGYDQ